MNYLPKTLFNPWLICHGSFYKPFISCVSLYIFICEVSESGHFSETVSWHGLYLLDVYQDLFRVEREGFWVLLACSVLTVSILDLNNVSIFAFLFHDQVTFLISNYWISDLTILSWPKLDHLQRLLPRSYSLVILEHKCLRTNFSSVHVFVSIQDVDVFVRRNLDD